MDGIEREQPFFSLHKKSTEDIGKNSEERVLKKNNGDLQQDNGSAKTEKPDIFADDALISLFPMESCQISTDVSSSMSFSISDDSYECSLDPYIGQDLREMVGQSLVVWSYKNPRSISLLDVTEDDSIYTLLIDARKVLEFEPDTDKLYAIEQAFDDSYIPVDDLLELSKATALLVLPKCGVILNVYVEETWEPFRFQLQPTVFVRDLKCKIETEIGYPVRQQDIICGIIPMENQKRICEYGVENTMKLTLALHKLFDIVLILETFWSVTPFHLVVDSCMRVSDVITRVFRKTSSRPDFIDEYETFIPKNMIVVICGDRVLDVDSVVGLNRLHDGDLVKVTTVALLNKIDMVTVKLFWDVARTGECERVRVSRFDKWSVVLLMASSFTGIPVDNLTLTICCGAGNEFVASMRNSLCDDIESGIDTVVVYCSERKEVKGLASERFAVSWGENLTDVVSCFFDDKIVDLKELLSLVSVPNARDYKLMTSDGRVCWDGERTWSYSKNSCEQSQCKERTPNNLSPLIKDKATNRYVNFIRKTGAETAMNTSKMKHKTLTHFTFYNCKMKFTICGLKNDVYTVATKADASATELLKKIQHKTEYDMKQHVLLLRGEPLFEIDTSDGRMISNSCTIYITSKKHHSFTIQSLYNKTFTFRVKNPTTLESIRRNIWMKNKLPENSILSMETFLKWYFSVMTPMTNCQYNQRFGNTRIDKRFL